MLRCIYKNEVTELLHLHAGLERKLKFTALDDNIREIEQMDLQRIYFEFKRRPRQNKIDTYLTCPYE